MKHHLETIRAYAARYPESYEESPWGDLAVKVRKKAFVFLGAGEAHLSLSMKLPLSRGDALRHEWASPTGYGLGKHGWCSFRFEGIEPPMAQLFDWIDESYRAVAPKTLVKKLPEGGPPEAEPAPVSTPVQARDLAVLLVGNDPLRLARAIEALAAGGVAAHAVPADDAALDAAGEGAPDVVVVDVSRDAVKTLALAAKLSAVAHDARLIVAGVRNAKMEAATAVDLPSAALSREPPGDPAVVALVLGD